MALQPIKWKSKIILAKVETVYATDAVPTGAVNAILMTNVSINPMEGQDTSRNLELPYLGSQETIPTGVYVSLQGDIEFVGSGSTGVAPAWGPLLRACGVAEVVTPDSDAETHDGTVEYTPVSDDHESLSLYFQIGPSRHVVLGNHCTGVVTMNAQGIPVIRLTVMGLFTVPADAARPTVDLSGFQKPQVVSKANTPIFTINGIAFAMRSFTLDLGNQISPTLLVNQEDMPITDRNEVLSATVRAVPLATYNPFALADSPTRVPIVLEHGTVAGKRVKIEVPTAQQRRPSGYQQTDNVLEWPLQFTPLPVDGDDQWKITLT